MIVGCRAITPSIFELLFILCVPQLNESLRIMTAFSITGVILLLILCGLLDMSLKFSFPGRCALFTHFHTVFLLTPKNSAMSFVLLLHLLALMISSLISGVTFGISISLLLRRGNAV